MSAGNTPDQETTTLRRSEAAAGAAAGPAGNDDGGPGNDSTTMMRLSDLVGATKAAKAAREAGEAAPAPESGAGTGESRDGDTHGDEHGDEHGEGDGNGDGNGDEITEEAPALPAAAESDRPEPADPGDEPVAVAPAAAGRATRGVDETDGESVLAIPLMSGDTGTTALRIREDAEPASSGPPAAPEPSGSPEDGAPGEPDAPAGPPEHGPDQGTAVLRLPAAPEGPEEPAEPEVPEEPETPEEPRERGDRATTALRLPAETPQRAPERPAAPPKRENPTGPPQGRGKTEEAPPAPPSRPVQDPRLAVPPPKPSAAPPAPERKPAPATEPPRPQPLPRPEPQPEPQPESRPRPDYKPELKPVDNPLALLAELTNRPAPRPGPLRTLARRIKIWTPLVLLLLIALTVVQWVRPLPEPALTLTAEESFTFEGETPAVPWPETGQAALDVDGIGSFGTFGEQVPVPIASVTKTMTAYVILRDHPMKTDEDGAQIPVDEQAEEDFGLGETRGDSVVPVQAGDTLTQREALQALMIASGNNIAWLLARWDSGSQEAFVRKMNDAAAELGMTNTTFTDPSGFDLGSVSTAEDLVKLGRAAMENPVLRQIVTLSEYTDQYGNVHRNGNFLVPVGGVVGIKTGSRTASGGNFLFAARQEAAGESRLIVGAVLAQPPHPSDNSIRTGAVLAGDELMKFAQQQLLSETILSAGDVVGHVDDGLGGRTPVTVTEDVRAVGWSGLEVEIELAGKDGELPGTAEAGTVVGSLTVGDGTGAVEVPIALENDLTEPGPGARLLRLG
ncbi:D-alanyl-D-alanine carboxypeptidase [Streptomyces aidingensis]|nr:D-alanyl-D-alanine carboxypeptidase [Streptomyces aidingensis]